MDFKVHTALQVADIYCLRVGYVMGRSMGSYSLGEYPFTSGHPLDVREIRRLHAGYIQHFGGYCGTIEIDSTRCDETAQGW